MQALFWEKQEKSFAFNTTHVQTLLTKILIYKLNINFKSFLENIL